MNNSGNSTRKATVTSASLEMMQPCSTAMIGNLLSSVAAFNVFRIDYLELNSLTMLLREMIRRGCLAVAAFFIMPCGPYRALSRKVAITSVVPATAPKPIQKEVLTPTIYMTTKMIKSESNPPANKKRY